MVVLGQTRKMLARLVRPWHFGVLAVVVLGLWAGGSATPLLASGEQPVREVVIEARQFNYEPGVIRVRKGETVRLVLQAQDVTHGFSLDGYGVAMEAIPGHAESVEFRADRVGKFAFRCTQVCGASHPFMTGSLIVEPNSPFWAALGVMAMVVFALFVSLWRMRGDAVFGGVSGSGAGLSEWIPRTTYRTARTAIWLDFLRSKVFRWLAASRAVQFLVYAIALAILVLVVTISFAGSSVGDHNLAIVLLWVVWWPLLLLVLMPLGGRVWCGVCPAPAPGEWLQRLAFLRKGRGQFSLGLRWPAWLRPPLLQVLVFAGVAALSGVVITVPQATGIALLAMVGGAVLLSLLFKGRTFCRFICPLGGFIGVYSQMSPLALRAKDEVVCKGHKEKGCVLGNGCGYGCPWLENPPTMQHSTNCGLCMECVRTCDRSNISFGLRWPDNLAGVPGRVEEAYQAVVFASVGILFTVVLFGPWGSVRTWLDASGMSGRFAYVGILAGVGLLGVPALLWGMSGLLARVPGSSGLTARTLWVEFSHALVPLGMAVWMAFALAALSNGLPHVPQVLADPMGRGWNLFGLGDVSWPRLLPGRLAYAQTALVLAGLAWGIVAWRRRVLMLVPAGKLSAWSVALPVGVLTATATGLIWVLLG